MVNLSGDSGPCWARLTLCFRDKEIKRAYPLVICKLIVIGVTTWWCRQIGYSQRHQGRPSDPPHLAVLSNLTGCADDIPSWRVCTFRFSPILPTPCICRSQSSYPARSLLSTLMTVRWLQTNLWHPHALIYQATPRRGNLRAMNLWASRSQQQPTKRYLWTHYWSSSSCW